MTLSTLFLTIGIGLLLAYASWARMEMRSTEDLRILLKESRQSTEHYKQLYTKLSYDTRDNEQNLRKRLHALEATLDSIADTITPGTVMYEVLVTAYAPYDNRSGICAADEDNPRTSQGIPPGWGYVAVNPEIIPYGTLMYIPGYGTAIAADTGYAVRMYEGIQIDVFMDSHPQAIKWGKQTLNVIILGTVKKEDWVGLKFIQEDDAND